MLLAYAGLMGIIGLQDLTWMADFTSHYTGALIVRNGLGMRLYDLSLQAAVQREVLRGRYLGDGLLPFNRPPHTALLLCPLTLFPLETAYWIWMGMNLIAWGWLLKSIYGWSQGWERDERLLALLTLTALPFWFRALALGAFSIWSMLFLWKFYQALQKKRETAAGLWLAMGSIHPAVTAFPLLALLGSRRWRALGAWAAGIGLFGLSSAGILGLPAWTGFLRILWFTGTTPSHPGIVPEHMYNLRGTLLSILGRSSWELVQAISWGSFALGAFAMLALWGQKPRSEVELDLRLGITVAAGLFLSPHLNPQDGLLMGLSALWLYGAVRDEPMHRRALGAVMVLSPLFFLLGETILGGRLGIGIPTIGILALGGWSLKAWRSTRAVAPLS